MIHGSLYKFLQEDHARLDDLLRRADAASDTIDLDAFELFRGGLLRHIAMEEKILLPEAGRLRNGEPLAIAKQLRADHAALAGLLVPTPTREIIATIRKLLLEHNPLEEEPGGLYEACEGLAGTEASYASGECQRSPCRDTSMARARSLRSKTCSARELLFE